MSGDPHTNDWGGEGKDVLVDGGGRQEREEGGQNIHNKSGFGLLL